MKTESIEQMKQTLEELIEDNKRLKSLEIRQRSGREAWFLADQVTAEISVDDEGNWYPSLTWETDGMTITIAEGHYSTRTIAKHKCEELYAEYGDLCYSTLKSYMSPETLPNAQVHPAMRAVVNNLAK